MQKIATALGGVGYHRNAAMQTHNTSGLPMPHVSAFTQHC